MSFGLQKQIKQNAIEIQSYVKDLYSWEDEMELKEKAKQKLKNQNRQNQNQIQNREIKTETVKKQQPITTQTDGTNTEEKNTKKKQLIRDTNTIQDYYRAWDTYNVDAELNKLEEQQRKAYKPYNPYEDSRNTIRAKPKATMKVTGGRQIVKDPTSLKDKGNLHFKVCQYEKAIDCYTECLNKLNDTEENEENRKLKALVFSNRAMAYIKINERGKALEDCNKSLQYDPRYTRSYLRRADCFRKLGKLKQALSDYERIKEINPEDKDTDIQIQKIKKILELRIIQARKNLIVANPLETTQGSYRIQIQQVQQFEEDTLQTKQEINYLQQL